MSKWSSKELDKAIKLTPEELSQLSMEELILLFFERLYQLVPHVEVKGKKK